MSLEKHPLKPIEEFGFTWDVTVTDHGQFEATLRTAEGDGTAITATTYAELRDNSHSIVLARRKRFAVVVSVLDTTTGEWRDGTIVSLHASNGNPIIKWLSTSRSEQLTGGRYSTQVFPRLSEDDKAELSVQVKARNSSSRNVQKLTLQHTDGGYWKLDKAIQAEIARQRDADV